MHTETVTFRPGVGVDGNDDPVTHPGAPVTVSGCVVEPLGPVEHLVHGRNTIRNTIRLYLTAPPAGGIPTGAVVTVRGGDYHVVAGGSDWPDDDLPCLVVDAYRTEG
ncbi:hypothetical protein G4X40_18565 [Rhodococcus sp. D2-41]|uniref:hypothetical protein n=1 Tax=Speluncibacter jeojiensis TaxID=2710754 RepID=UPI00240EFBEA|nr:hypothetical protein [Rhodococcus sp. D2-41]MDG3012149.1 hypothetical protein [Rhodococcus sp. D2-41]